MRNNNKKKQTRKTFRKDVFQRDNFTCKICGLREKEINLVIKNDYTSEILDCHHITPREQMLDGGYIKENGITLCKIFCHEEAEKYLHEETTNFKFSPKELYKIINSSLELARKKLARNNK